MEKGKKNFICLLFNVVMIYPDVGQSLGHDLCIREKFDVVVARAVAEMRVLGTI